MNNYKLRSLFWECTLRCNAYCKFCGSRCGDVETDEVDADTVLKTLSELASRYNAEDIMINVTGGEPLLRRDLFEVMSKASGMGFPWGMVTNGVLINDDIIDKMKTSGMKTVSVSIDGTKEIHEALRGLNGCYDKIIGNLKKLKAADFLDCIQVTTVVNKQNIDDLENLYRQLSELNLTSWRVALVDPIGRACDNKDLLLGDSELKKHFDFLSSHRSYSDMDIITSCSHYLGGYDSSFRSGSFFCGTGKRVASILANGDIFVCPNVERRPELIQGNIRTDSLAEVWEKGFAYFRREDARLSKKCKDCDKWPDCMGDSMHTWDFDNSTQKFCIKDYNIDMPPTPEERLFDDIKNLFGPFSAIDISYGSDINKRTAFTPDASDKLYEYFDWGKKTPVNMCEQLAALYGHYVGNTFLVEYVTPIHLQYRSTTEATFTEFSYRQAMTELEILNKNAPELDRRYSINHEPFVLGGFAHSHPLELDAVMSVPDKKLHDRLLKEVKDYTTSVILNPQKKEIYSFYSNKYSVIDINILTRDAKKWDIS